MNVSPLLAASAALLLAAACDVGDGPAEEAGEALDETGEAIQERAEEAGDTLAQACEELSEGMGASRDC